jgi:hypothetical protein
MQGSRRAHNDVARLRKRNRLSRRGELVTDSADDGAKCTTLDNSELLQHPEPVELACDLLSQRIRRDDHEETLGSCCGKKAEHRLCLPGARGHDDSGRFGSFRRPVTKDCVDRSQLGWAEPDLTFTRLFESEHTPVGDEHLGWRATQ